MRHLDDALILAYGTGKQKKWSKEHIIIQKLYDTGINDVSCIKVKDFNLLGKCDEEDDKWFKFAFGYLNRLPRTKIVILINKHSGKIMLEKDTIGLGFENVEEEVYKFIEKQIKLKNIYYKTNWNFQEFLIK